MSEKETCFVIMPFGSWFDHYYKQIYKKAILDAGLNPKRADELFTSSAVINDIWDLTKKAKVILADLTEKNPNVFYELGLAHALAKPAILISETIDDVPFDLRHLRVITYDKNDVDWGQKLISDITNAIKETLSAPEDAVLPTFLNSDDVSSQISESTDNPELRDLKHEVVFIKNTVAQLVKQNQFSDRISCRVSSKSKNSKRPPQKEIIAVIQSGLKKGASESRILNRISGLNVPVAEAEKLLDEIKSENDIT